MNRHRLYVISTDIFHTLLGFVTVQLAKHVDLLSSYITYAVAYTLVFITLFAYIAYQIIDDDPPEERLADLVEYASGMILGLAI